MFGNFPVVTATDVFNPNDPQGKNEVAVETAGVDAYSEEQLVHIGRLSAIKYCVNPEYYLTEAIPEYQPKDPLESQEGYDARTQRALSAFQPYYDHLRNLIVGTALRQGIQYDKTNEQWNEFFKNVDLEGSSLVSFAKKAFIDALDGGVAGLWADYPTVRTDLTVAEQAQLALRPYWVKIKNDDLLDIRHEIIPLKINGQTLLARFPVYVRLKAVYEEKSENEFIVTRYPAVRVYDIVILEGAQRVRWRLYAQKKGQGESSDTEKYEEVKSGSLPIPFIPFVPLYGGNIEGYSRARPQLLDIARLNLHHWCIAADLAYSIHNSSSDQLYGTGIRQDEDIHRESDKLLTAEDPQANFGMLSPEMKGADAALKNLERIEQAMERLAAVAMTTSKAQAESGFSKLLDRAQSDSQLAVLVQSLEDSFNLLIQYTAVYWATDPIKISVSKDFIPVKMHSQQVMALLAVWQKFPIPVKLMFEIYKSGMLFEGVAEFEVEDVLKELGLEGDETSLELGYATDARKDNRTLVSSDGAAPAEGSEPSMEATESAQGAMNG